MTLQKIYVGSKDKVPITCSNCGRTKYIEVAKVNNLFCPFRVKCNCGFSFRVVFEKRGHYRRDTSLPGYCKRVDADDPGWVMTVVNLSKTGIGFKTQGTNDIAPGDHLTFEFKLDDNQKTVVKGTIFVACVKETYVGGKFQNLPEHTKKQVGFYLMR